jgi:hypothetical protein
MNIVKNINQYDENNIFFCEPTKNNVMNEGNFIRILYSTHNVVLNGIYLLITFNDISCEKYYTKYRCCFNVNTHIDTIKNLKIIEEDIINEREDEDEIAFESKLMDEILARAKFEYRNCKNIQSKIINS